MENEVDKSINEFKKHIYKFFDEVNNNQKEEFTKAQDEFVDEIEVAFVKFLRERHKERLEDMQMENEITVIYDNRKREQIKVKSPLREGDKLVKIDNKWHIKRYERRINNG